MKKVLFFITAFAFSLPLLSQDILEGRKIWYSVYLSYKLNKKINFDTYTLSSFNGIQHSFSFLQNDINANYVLSKKSTITIGYSYAMYAWNISYKSIYGHGISPLGTLDFQILSAGYKYETKLSKNWEIDQNVSGQFYLPQLEKYQYRLEYAVKISYKEKATSFRIKPFIQGVLFYYLNGIPTYYYANNKPTDYSSPNGLHRYRTKLGLSFRPIKKFKRMSTILYYTIQKEFNLSFLGGHDLNIATPIDNTNNSSTIVYPFNNYSIIGLQANFFL